MSAWTMIDGEKFVYEKGAWRNAETGEIRHPPTGPECYSSGFIDGVNSRDEEIKGLEAERDTWKNKCNGEENRKVLYKPEGSMIMAHYEDFINRQASPCGFGRTNEEALAELEKSNYNF